MHTERPRVVAIRPGALGDTLLALPTLALLRRAWPPAAIVFVARADILPLARASGLADEVSAYEDAAWSALFTSVAPTGGAARELLGGAAAAVAWLPDADGAVARRLAELGARRVSVAPGRPAPDAGEHAARHLARALAPLGIAPLGIAPLGIAPLGIAPLGIAPPTDIGALWAALPSLRSPPADEAAAAEMWRALDLAAHAGQVVALHLGSGGAAKRWPPGRFAALAGMMADAGYDPLVLEGPGDAEVVAEMVASGAGDDRALPIARGLRVGALAALLGRCAGYAGNDSGVSHLAGLLGLPTLALFGPTDPAVWSPLGPRVRCLMAPAGRLDQLPAAAVWRALRPLLAAP